MMTSRLLPIIAASALLFTSCKDTEKPDTVQKVPYAGLNAGSNYIETFKGPDYKSSVDFSGQATRVKMLQELDAYMRTATTTSLQAAKMKDMFAHQNSPFNDPALNNATDKTLISKTAQSFSAVQADAQRQIFMAYFDSLAATSQHHGQIAAQGQAGKLDGKYLVNAKGFEYNQFIQKGLIGALMLDQISNIYLGTEKQNADNQTIVSGKNYTQLEHHWDEAYGYLSQNARFPMEDPANPGKFLDNYLGGYVRQVKSPYGDPAAVYMAFLKGRAAIVNKDEQMRLQQIAFIRTSLEKAVATIAISYLNKTKTATSDGSKFHALSEGLGFIYALRFAHDAKINQAKSDQLIQILSGKTHGFWSLTNADLDQVRDEIAQAVGIDKNAVVNH